MNKKNKKIIGLIILLSCILLFVGYKSITKTPSLQEDVEFREKLKSTIASESTIEFKLIADFDWDKMVIVPPYATLQTEFDNNNINKINIDTTIQTGDSINLILFCKNKDVVKYINFDRNFGDFELAKTKSFEKNNATFNVEKNNNKIILKQLNR